MDALRYDRAADRWLLRGVPLHAGDGLLIRLLGTWVPARIERHPRHGWVLLVDEGVRLLPSPRLPARPEPSDGRWA
jgi:hypothetical protein